jgi:hypothetical protein
MSPRALGVRDHRGDPFEHLARSLRDASVGVSPEISRLEDLKGVTGETGRTRWSTDHGWKPIAVPASHHQRAGAKLS